MGSTGRASFEAVTGKAEELPVMDLQVATRPGVVLSSGRQGCHG